MRYERTKIPSCILTFGGHPMIPSHPLINQDIEVPCRVKEPVILVWCGWWEDSLKITTATKLILCLYQDSDVIRCQGVQDWLPALLEKKMRKTNKLVTDLCCITGDLGQVRDIGPWLLVCEQIWTIIWQFVFESKKK